MTREVVAFLKKNRYRLLGLIFFAVWLWSAVSANYPDVWLLENILVFLFVPLLIWLVHYFRLSFLSVLLIVLFLCLHLVGAHYSYAGVPFGKVLGSWLGTDRNVYDRLVHFSFGLLMAYPIREMLFRVAKVRGVWGYILPLDMTLSMSAVFELIEWGVVVVSGSNVGVAFLATQGDFWDAQGDMSMATLGAFVTLAVIGMINWFFSQPFREEVRESLKAQTTGARPVTEMTIRELRRIIREKRQEHKRQRQEKRRIRKKSGGIS